MVWQGSLSEMLDENTELTEDEELTIRGLMPGQSYEFGEGLRVERVGDRVMN
jgi:hypothetical protein